MSLLMLLFKGSLAIFMVGSLLEMGLRLSLPAAFQGLRNVRFVAYSLLWGFILCPALAWGITKVIPLAAPYALGMVLLGMAPCAPFVPMLVDKAKGDLGFTAAFMVLASVGTVFFMPFAVPFMTEGLTASAWTIAKPLLIVVLIPMTIGVIVRLQADAFATKALPLVKKLSGLTGLVFCVVMLILYGKGLLGMAGSFAVLAEVLFFAIAAGASYLLAFGLSPDRKIVLSIGVMTRNIGACMAPLLSVADMDQRATLMMVLALPIMVAAALLMAKLATPAAGSVPAPAQPLPGKA